LLPCSFQVQGEPDPGGLLDRLRIVRTLVDEHQSAGMHTLRWNGRDDDGAQLSSGIYFYRLKAKNFDQTKKMVLMK